MRRIGMKWRQPHGISRIGKDFRADSECHRKNKKFKLNLAFTLQ